MCTLIRVLYSFFYSKIFNDIFNFRTGLLWSCPLTQSATDCKALRAAVPGHDLPPRLDERRDDQWLGVSVDSQGPGIKTTVLLTSAGQWNSQKFL
jgi:hypothetical protein